MKLKKLGNSLQPIRLLVAVSIFVAGVLSYPVLLKHNFLYVPPEVIVPVAAPVVPESLDVCFTPKQSCLPKVIKAIDNAKSSIVLLGYSFTSKPITQALIKAKNRGVKVRMILDHSQRSQKYSMQVIDLLLTEKIPIRFDHSVKIAHNKIIVLDGKQTVTGSYNWTHSAEFKNAENLVFINSPKVAQQYCIYFEGRWKVSKPQKD